MPHPYIRRRAEMGGFLGLLCLFSGYAALTGEPRIVDVRHRLLELHDAVAVYRVGCILLFAGISLLAFAVYCQVRLRPSVDGGSTAESAWPPRGARAWFGIVTFVLVALLMAAIVLLHVLMSAKT